MKTLTLLLALGWITGFQGYRADAALYPGRQREHDSSQTLLTIPMRSVNSASKGQSGKETQTDFTHERIPVSKMALSGQSMIEGKPYILYLSASVSYTNRNIKGEDTDNTSSMIYVDENRDGWISPD